MKRDHGLTVHATELGPQALAGKVIAVVGGTGGIGRSLALDLTGKGARVIVVGRSFQDRGVAGIEFLKADLSLMAEAGRVAAELPAETMDMVVFTTGIMAGPKREVTSEGIERDLAVSYLSRFVILRGIAPRLGTERPDPAMRPRVFVMGFPGTNQTADPEDLNSERTYKRMRTHGYTVAGNEALVLDAAKRYPHLDVFGLNPGFVKTDIRANLFGSRAFLKVVEFLTAFMTVAPETYARRIVPLLVAPDLNGRSGAMFNNKAEAILPSARSKDAAYVVAVMGASERLVDRATAKN
jgi:NAD(P)-dependent dehydrogenase (short-subunit alcohol dehydrogenase family)